MNIIVHYPTDKYKIEALQNVVAAEHAKYVVNYISNLNCSDNKKWELIENISSK